MSLDIFLLRLRSLRCHRREKQIVGRSLSYPEVGRVSALFSPMGTLADFLRWDL